MFFNPLRLSDFQKSEKTADSLGRKGARFVVGMVGRNADVKDWPSFHTVEQLVQEKIPGVMFLNAGETKVCDGREAIAKMDLFVMTSKSEQLPTAVLECFAIGTPICGFIPDGGMAEILAFSSGPLKDVFIKDRDTSRLAEIVVALLRDEEKRNAVVEDGWRILNDHFAAEKLVPGKLMEIYRRFVQ